MTPPQTRDAQLRVARATVAADDSRWDAFVRSTPGASFCHLSGWRGIIEDVLGREYLQLVAVTPDGEWEGIMPLVCMKTPLLTPSMISLPFLNYGGPVGSDAAQVELLQAALREAGSARAAVLQVRNRWALPVLAPAARAKVLVLLDLPDSPSVLWQQFPAKLRSQIRRPLKDGMEFRAGAEQLDAFYGVFARNMRDLGTPVHSIRFFRSIAERFPEFTVGAVYMAGRPVAAGAGFTWRGEFEMTWASSLRAYRRQAPNMLLYWSFIEAMIGRSVSVFNFGRCTPGGTTHNFKLQWGGRTVPLPWLEWTLRPGARGGPSRLAHSLSSAWRRLPLPLANALGPVLARRLPWW